MQKSGADEKELAAAREAHGKALTKTVIAELKAEKAAVEFEIDKRKDFEDDAELTKFKKREQEILAELKKLGVDTAPATQPK
jgi:hypothetical protein